MEEPLPWTNLQFTVVLNIRKKEFLKENTPHIAVSLCFEGPISMAK